MIFHTHLLEAELYDLHITQCLTHSSIISPATYLSFNQLFTFHLSHQPLPHPLAHPHISILQISTLTSCLMHNMMLSFCMLHFSSYLCLFAQTLMRKGNYIFKHKLQIWRFKVSVWRCWLIYDHTAHIQYAGWEQLEKKNSLKSYTVTGYIHRYTSHRQKQRQK